jgi:hypothetical protein
VAQHRGLIFATGAALLIAAIVAGVLALARTRPEGSAASDELASARYELGAVSVTPGGAASVPDDQPAGEPVDDTVAEPGAALPSDAFYIGVKGLGEGATLEDADCVGDVQQVALEQLEAAVATDIGTGWSAFALGAPRERCNPVRVTVRPAGDSDVAVQITGRLGPAGLADVQCEGAPCRIGTFEDRPVTLVRVG